jgi:hypothetical protein
VPLTGRVLIEMDAVIAAIRMIRHLLRVLTNSDK